VDRDAKIKIAAVGAIAILLALAVGAAGAIGVSRVLDGDGERGGRPDIELVAPSGFDFDRDFFDPRDFEREGIPRLGLPFFGDLDAAVSYLQLPEDELRDRLADGETLAEIAEEEGKSVDGLVDAMLEEATESLDEAVDEGVLSRERADEIEGRLEERIRDLVEGELRGLPFEAYPGYGFERPFEFGDRPPFFSAPNA
jgi:hypothetical protein